MTNEDHSPRLCAASAGIRLKYDRARITPGIVHLGIGAFHRAHMAAYVDELLATDPTWGIIGASLRRPDTRNALAPQDFLYTPALRSGSGASSRTIGSLLDVLDATTQRRELLAAMADPRIRIVSLTVTEKGYCHDPATGDPGHPDIRGCMPLRADELRMLNGSHSTLAYLGYLAGYEFVSEAISDPAFRSLIHSLMTEEVMGTLPKAVGDLEAYRDALLDRFANPTLRHRTWQIAMDGSQKLPQRLLGTIRDRLAEGRSVTLAALGVAGWMRYVTGIDEQGREIDVRDPLAARLRSISEAAAGDPKQLVSGLLEVSEVFGDDLPRSEVFRSVLTGHVASLLRRSSLETVRDLARGHAAGK